MSLLLLYFALLAVSLFNAMLLLWLGLTVVLNAEHRGWGLGFSAVGLFAGGAVFISQAAVLMESASVVGPELNVWWPLAWAAVIFAPYAWYLAMLWYAGYWETGDSALRRRHRLPLLFCSLLSALMLVLLLIAHPLPFTVQKYGLALTARPAIFNLPLVVLLYPPFILTCIGLALEVLFRPGPLGRALGGAARRRARPWLLGTSFALLAVSLVTMATLFWLLTFRERKYLTLILDNLTITVFWLDLLLSVLLSGAVLLLGQAIIAYEIFTGKALPTQGLRRQWHNAIMLAAGYSLAVGGTLALQLPGVYVILPATLLIILALALFGRRVYWERERHMAALRPFVASDQVYDSVLTAADTASTEGEMRAAFINLARDLLKVKLAWLLPVGGFSTLVAPLGYPDSRPPVLAWDKLLSEFAAPEVKYRPLDPENWQGANWALPLRNSRGLIGLLLLGEKQDRGLFSQEEMEIARAGGERLLDNIATAHLAQRLMTLQRQRFVAHQVLDQQSRRTLHDEILPNLHTALLNLSGEAGDLAKVREQLAEAHRRISALLREMPSGSDSQVGTVGLLKALQQMLAREFAADFAEINWQIDSEAERRAKAIPALSGEVIFYAAKEIMRNAARHGRGEEAGPPLNLQVSLNWAKGLELCIADNGVGIRESRAAGGQGLALHGTLLAVIGGSLALVNQLESGGTAATIFLPAALWESWSKQA